MKKVQPWVKIAGIALVAIVAGVILNATGVFKNGNSKGLSLFGGGDVITVGTNTYAGFLPFMYLNNGLEPNEDCILYKEYGLKLKIVIQDDFQAGRIAFKNGNIDIIYCTADALPVEMGENSEMSEARFFNISNWSRGADALVVNKNIMKVSDLVGKVIACSEGTASHTLLLNTLETSGIGYDKVNLNSTIDPKKVNIKVVSDGLAAAQVFKSGQCDGAVVYSPDDQDIVQAGIG
jgi:NitT/TauT family transport system substrate-binding protein